MTATAHTGFTQPTSRFFSINVGTSGYTFNFTLTKKISTNEAFDW
jgi:hypothetical protein